MLFFRISRKIEFLLSISIFLVAVFVTPNLNLDPINLPKMWALITISSAVLAILIYDIRNLIKTKLILPLIFIVLLIGTLFLSTTVSKAPFPQKFFGAYGRNTGLLTYICFALLFIGAATGAGNKIKKPLIISSGAAFVFNAIYGLIQALGVDPIKWVNPYSPVIGTLGNPELVSMFLGLGIGVSFTYLLAAPKSKYKIAIAVIVAISLFDIYKTNFRFGFLLAIHISSLVLFIKLRTTRINIHYLRAFKLALAIFSGFIVLAIWNFGPFAFIFNKTSISNTRDLSETALNMIKGHPFLGVGIDSFGDWFRSSRSLRSTLQNGSSSVADTSHNYILDIAATAGIVAAFIVVILIVLGFQNSLQILKKNKQFEPFKISVFTTWVSTLIISLVTMNILILTIHWIVLGLLFAIKRWDTEKSLDINKANISNQKNRIDFSGISLGTGLIIGLIIGFIPFNTDANFRNALEKGDAQSIYGAALKWPQANSRMLYAAQIFDKNGFPDKALAMTKEIVKLNPRNYSAWIYIFNAKSTTNADKRKILRTLKTLDPHNPEISKL